MTQHPTAQNAGTLLRPHGAQVTATAPIPAVRWATPLSPVPPTIAGAVQPHRPAATIPPVRMPHASGSVQQRMPGIATQGKQGHAIPPVRIAGTHSPALPTMAGAVTPQRAEPAGGMPPLSVASAHGSVQAKMPSAATASTAKATMKSGVTTFRRPAPSPAIQCLPFTDLERTPGYAQWKESGETWHINYTLGDNKHGREIYHVTKESEKKIHYFFSKDVNGDFRDEVGTGRKETRKKFSNLPKNIQDTVKAIW